jgi:hypothetical protein
VFNTKTATKLLWRLLFLGVVFRSVWVLIAGYMSTVGLGGGLELIMMIDMVSAHNHSNCPQDTYGFDLADGSLDAILSLAEGRF